MNRRLFFKGGVMAAAGAALLNTTDAAAGFFVPDTKKLKGRAKNIIFCVADGMSTGTLAMADRLLQRHYGRPSAWMDAYRTGKAVRGLMDTSSVNGIVTDSAASSSAWGGGRRVNNGSLNVNADGTANKPIWQKMKAAGKKVGCVTTVPVTHATPAGFCISSAKRDAQAEIAEMYKALRFDVMMGGGDDYFNAGYRKDKRDMYTEFATAGYHVARNRDEMFAADGRKPVIGVFGKQGLPYALDRQNSKTLTALTPSLAEMAAMAIKLMQDHPNGFCLQIEGGKVDWAAHANDTPALVYDQVAFDEAVALALDFAGKRNDTLVIITTDHGNGNPGVMYDNHNSFDTLARVKQSNEFVLTQIKPGDNTTRLKECINNYQGYSITDEEAKSLMDYYRKTAEGGLYNAAALPMLKMGEVMKKYNYVFWASDEHSGDYVELAMVGPGSEMLKPFTRNTELHNFMLHAAGVNI